jgi:RNA-binding protein
LWDKEAVSHREGKTFQTKELRRLQARSRRIDPTIWIGKQGVSEHLGKQVENQLKSRELVKLRLQKSALTQTETSAVAERVAVSTGSTLIEVIGHTFTLYKRRDLSSTARKGVVGKSHFSGRAN